MDDMRIEEPSHQQFIEITGLIASFELDARSLHVNQFLAANSSGKLIGFGRIRKYDTCSELCSLGVIEPQRNKGIGRLLVQELIKKAMEPLYLVCIIPDFFLPLGFEITPEYPGEIKAKLDYCRLALSVPEEYVVMKYNH